MNVSPSLRFLARMWWGPLRRPFEALVRRALAGRSAIQFGPLRGRYFSGGLTQILGIYEIHVQRVLYNLLKPGHVFYDIGANNGYFALLAAHLVQESGRVYAFEPFPDNVRLLHEVILRNSLTNCELVERAASKNAGVVQLYAAQEGNHATPSLLGKATSRTLSVTTITLDDFALDHVPPDVVKVDVEGAEDFVLAGALRLMSSDVPPVFVIEVHSEEKERSIRLLLRRYGYRVHVVSPLVRQPVDYPHHVVAHAN